MQDVFRIEVPVYLKDDIRINPSSLGDPVPCKPDGCSVPDTSPAGLADDPSRLAFTLGGSTATFSQPNSATSTTAWLDAELQLTSRQSSASDLGAQLSPGSTSSAQEEEQSAFCLQLYQETVEAITLFDRKRCTHLAAVKAPLPHLVLPNEPVDGPSAKMLPVYQSLKSDRGETRVPGLNVRLTRAHSNTLSQPSNPYNLSALLADFKLQKNTKSPAAGARPPSPHPLITKSASSIVSFSHPRPEPFQVRHFARSVSAPVAEDEPRSMVMIPGMRRKA